MKSDILVEYLCNLQAPPIRERLLANTEFTNRFGLIPRHGLLMANAEIDLMELFTIARHMLTDKKERTLLDTTGNVIHLAYENSEIVLKKISKTKDTEKAKLNELFILSPHPEERQRAFDSLTKYMGPAVPDFSSLQAVIRERELSDQEAEQIFHEIMRGVTSVQKKFTHALRIHDVTIDNLIPDSLSYFEHFCGPNPGTAPPETYLCNILPTYRKEMLRRDLVRGLDICLYGALRDDLSPGQWTCDVTNDDLWNALIKCKPNRDPFSLLGALDIALYRQIDERYLKFANNAVTKLVHHDFPRPDGIDTYQFLPLLTELVLNRINIIEGGTTKPPYWKRMCAWMQSLFIACQTLPYRLEFEPFSGWITSQMTLAGFYATFIDLRSEPMYEAAAMSSVALRQETIGRLVALRLRHQNEGREIPKTDEIDKAVTNLTSPPHGLPWSCALPGPLEGHKRPADGRGVIFPLEEAKEIANKLEEDKDESRLSMLAHFSQFFDLGETLLQSARKMSDEIDSIGVEEKGRLQRLAWITDACAIAAAHRDIVLAKIIGNKIVSFAREAISETQVEAIFRGILFAGSAFENEEEWAVWLEEQLTKIAATLPCGKMSKAFLEHLEELKKVTKLSLRIHTRAAALASSAI